MDASSDPEQIVLAERQLRDTEASEYDRLNAWLWWEDRALNACFQQCLELCVYHTVLDVGCGTGRHLPRLSPTASRVIGVDHSAASLEVARTRVAKLEHAWVDLRVADVRRLPVADESVDRLLCSEVLQHIPGHHNRSTVARELYRVLRPGGVAVIAAYRWLGAIKLYKEGFFGDGPLYRYAFTVHEFAGLWEQAGFSEVRVGGVSVLPKLSKALNIRPEAQRPLVFTPIGRNLGQYVVAWVRKRSSRA